HRSDATQIDRVANLSHRLAVVLRCEPAEYELHVLRLHSDSACQKSSMQILWEHPQARKRGICRRADVAARQDGAARIRMLNLDHDVSMTRDLLEQRRVREPVHAESMREQQD